MKTNTENYRFYLNINEAVDNNDLEAFKNLLICKEHSHLSKEERGTLAFKAVYFAHNDEGMDYLIFDYGLTLNDDITQFCAYNELLTKKFEMRSLATELSEKDKAIQKKLKM